MTRHDSRLTALERLLAGLPVRPMLPAPEVVAAADLPPLARRLLDHHEHMTEIMEAYHGGRVAVEVQQRQRVGDEYFRQIVLRVGDRPDIVQGGLVRIFLPGLGAPVAEAILAENVPLGYLLRQHQVLRRVELTYLLRFPAHAALADWLGGRAAAPAYGRLARLHCDGAPVIELCEVLPPGCGESV
ncbi:MAG TPA: hypothetical protein PKD86_12575 [Gemmatales bacterium]|nr:hypothetical protein [Gemmatales bacterium]HMP60177.1 hypothetical protein [Gemmatales bacterium]